MSVTVGGQEPRTVWDHCLVWAELLLGVHLQYRADFRHDQPYYRQHLTPEQHMTWEGSEQPLTVVLLAAALHRQIELQGLGEAPQTAAGALLHVPGEDGDGVEQLLRTAPYAALEEAPDVAGRGSAERGRLLDSGASLHPDGPLLWQRVRTAALGAIEGVVQVGRGTSITLHDILVGQARKAKFERLEAVFGEEY